MRNALILIVLTISAFFVHSTGAYWTVRYRSDKLDYNWYWAEYELWETDLSKNISMGDSTHKTCAFSRGYTSQDILFSDNGGSWGGCKGTEQVSAFGTNTELHSLHVYKSSKVFNCALMEVGTGYYKTYICGDAPPPVPSSAVTSTATTTATATVTVIVVPTSAATTTTTITTVITATTTTTKAPTTTAAPTCIVGYRGKRNGKGPNGACCSSSDDCKDTCVKLVCGASP